LPNKQREQETCLRCVAASGGAPPSAAVLPASQPPSSGSYPPAPSDPPSQRHSPPELTPPNLPLAPLVVHCACLGVGGLAPPPASCQLPGARWACREIFWDPFVPPPGAQPIFRDVRSQSRMPHFLLPDFSGVMAVLMGKPLPACVRSG